MNLTINYYPQITGNGKSTVVLKQVAESAESYVIAVPSKDLCYGTVDSLKSIDPTISLTVVNSDEQLHGQNTASRLINAMRFNSHRVIVTTHATLKLAMAQGIVNAGRYNLVIDEKMDFFESFTVTLNDWSLSSLDDLLSFKKDEDLYGITVSDSKQIREILKGDRKDSLISTSADSEFTDLLTYASNDRFKVSCTEDNYDRYMNRETTGKEKRFTALSMIDPEVFGSFKSCTMLSSFFDHTVAFKILAKDFNMVRCSLPNEKTVHSGSENLHIHFYSDFNWTTAKRNKVAKGTTKTILNYVWDYALASIGEEPFIYHMNVDARHLAENVENGTLLTSLHGLNSWSHMKHAVFLSSLNASPQEVNSLAHYLPDGRAALDYERNVLECYQFISRTAIRRDDNTEEVHVYVPDKRCSDFLKSVFINAVIVEEEVDEIEKRKEKLPSSDRRFYERQNLKISNGVLLKEKAVKRYHEICEKYGRENRLATN